MNTDKYLFFSVSALIAIGIFFSLTLSSFTVLYFNYPKYHFFIRQFVVGLLGILIMWGLSKANPDKKIFGDMTVFEALGFSILFVSSLIMIIMQFLPTSLVPYTGGAKRWIKFGHISLSPVEFFKIGFIFFLSWSFNRKINNKERTLKQEFKILAPYLFVFGIVIFVVAVLQKDLGQVVALSAILAILAIFAGTSIKTFGSIIVFLLSAIVIFIAKEPHRIRRFESWWISSQDMFLSFLPESFSNFLRIESGEAPYQITHSLNAIYHGGFFGEGLGSGTIKLGFLSEVHTDFVLAGMAEEIGFLGVLLICFLMLYVIYRILKISGRIAVVNRYYHLFALGIGMLISISFLMNAYGVTSITPIKGIAVPFLSYGGSSILALCIGVGMVLMISKKADLS